MNRLKKESITKYNFFLALISGLLLGISFPKIGFWWCAWISLVPLFIALRSLSCKDAFKIGFVAGISHFFIVMNWLIFVLKTYTEMPCWQYISLFLILIFYLSLYPAFFSLIVSFLSQNPYDLMLIAPSAWVVSEYARGILFSGFPWELIGYSQFEQLSIIQISDLFGIYGVSFILVVFNVCLSLVFLYGRNYREHLINIEILFRCCSLVLILLILTIGYGFWRISDVKNIISSAEFLKIGIVQGNIDQSLKWNSAFQVETTKKYIFLSKLISLDNLDLIVWPETATPFCFEEDIELTELVMKAIKTIKSDFVIGAPTLIRNFKEGESNHYNSAYLIGSDGKIKGRYNKSHLVPFGEYFPLKWLSSFFDNIVIRPYGFRAGVLGDTLECQSKCCKLGLQICYEIIFPKLSRLMVLKKSNLLINLTNDAWFGDTSATYQHFSMSVFRAIENRRSVVRAANTGISGFIDPTGSIVDRTSIQKDEVLINTIPILYCHTLYTKLGDFFVLICLFIIIVYFFKLPSIKGS